MTTPTAPATCLVVDLEATTSDDGTVPRDAMETLEIGAVRVRLEDGAELARFSAVVRPARSPALHPFCVALTGITQAEVDGAAPFPAVFAAFCAAMEVERFSEPLASWGHLDRVLLQRDCAAHGVAWPRWTHLNLRQAFSRRQGHRRRYGLAFARAICGLPAAPAHRALADARAAAELLPWILGARRVPKGAARALSGARATTPTT
ncbi:MAG: exonuclease domain-containing protein [Myxococcales bacterium]|nr:exonuclease domain-containing protein [Myxococcales bacterium]